MLLASLIVALPLAYAAAPSASFAANGDITFAPTEAWADVKDGRTLSDGVNPVISMSTTAGSSATFTLAGDNLNFSLFGQKATNQGLHTISLDGTESEIDFFRPDPDLDPVIDVEVVFSGVLCGDAEHNVVITHGGEDARNKALSQPTFLALLAYATTPLTDPSACSRQTSGAGNTTTSLTTTTSTSSTTTTSNTRSAPGRSLVPPTTRPPPPPPPGTVPSPNIVTMSTTRSLTPIPPAAGAGASLRTSSLVALSCALVALSVVAC